VRVAEGLLGLLLAWHVTQAADYQAGREAFLAGDWAAARAAWLAAAEAPEPEPLAELGLGVLYEHGLGVARSSAVALHWYRKAAEHGLPEAAYQVGLMFELGLGVAQDPWTAEWWYETALGETFCPGEIPDPLQRITRGP